MRRPMRWRAMAMAVAAVGFILGGPATTDAALIAYAFSGTGTGDLGGVAFADAAFRVELVGDTSDINFTEFGPHAPAIFDIPGTITIEGVGTATFSNLGYVYNNQGLDFPTPDLPFAGFGGFRSGQLGDNAFLTSPPLVSYGLDTPFGPVTADEFFVSDLTSLDTDRGVLNLIASGPATFEATLAPVPEPSTLLLCGTAGVALLRHSQLRRRRRIAPPDR